MYLKYFANLYICIKAVSYAAVFMSVMLTSKQKFQ